MENPRLIRLKERTLHYTFTIQYNPGKWHRAADALSRNPHQSPAELNEIFLPFVESEDEQMMNDLHCAEFAISSLDVDLRSICIDDIRKSTSNDSEMKSLISTIEHGFPETYHLTDPCIRKYYNVKDGLWIQDGLVMLRDRIVIPAALRKHILNILHSSHQGVEGMRCRAKASVYWPGLNSSIREKRRNCNVCEEIAPSQSRQQLSLIDHAEYPFQHVCSDAFEMNGHYYLAIVDRYSSWLIIFHFKSPPQSRHVINCFRSTFTTYGSPQKIFTDGGLVFQAKDVQDFLKQWAVTHVTSSAMYPQANGRAELAVKTAKRLLRENTAIDGSLNSHAASQALLQYRNTPIQHLGLSPAQVLFHRDLKDGIPVDPRKLRPHRKWIDAAMNREEAFRHRNEKITEKYNCGTRFHKLIPIGTDVLIQNTTGLSRGKWDKSGTIVDQVGRKYFIRMHGSGRIITRNRRFIKISPVRGAVDADSFVYPNFNETPERETITVPLLPQRETITAPLLPEAEQEIPDLQTPRAPPQPRTPLMRRRLRPHNRRGRKEQ